MKIEARVVLFNAGSHSVIHHRLEADMMRPFTSSLPWNIGGNGRCRGCRLHRPSTSPPASVIATTLRHKHSQSKRRSQSSKKWLERQHKDPYVALAQNQGLPSRASFKLKEINEELFPSILSGKQRRGDATNRQKRKRLILPDMLVVDLGAAPGGWSLYASTQLNPHLGGAVVACDLLSLEETLQSNSSDVASRIQANLQSNFEFIQGDFTANETRMQIVDAFARVTHAPKGDDGPANPRRPALVLSDMAANFTGDSLTDAIRTIDLCERALAFAAGGGCFDASYSAADSSDGTLDGGGAFLCKYFSCGKENEEDLMGAARRAFRSVHIVKPDASRKESSEMYLLGLDFKGK